MAETENTKTYGFLFLVVDWYPERVSEQAHAHTLL